MLEQSKPAAAEPDGAFYIFERGVKKTGGGDGWADVWMREHFAWESWCRRPACLVDCESGRRAACTTVLREYKGKHKDLAAVYQQLLLNREDLENPPLLVVCDSVPLRGTHELHRHGEAALSVPARGPSRPSNLDVLRRLFTEPNSLCPDQPTARITEQTTDVT